MVQGRVWVMITLALIGRGRWGKNYIKTINNLSSCVLPEKYIKTSNYKELFDLDNIDGVIVATPSPTHFKIAKEFLEKGFNVLIEKPMTINYKDALKLFKIADKRKNFTMVGHIYLYNPAFLEVKNLVKSIGKIKYISSEGMSYGPIRKDISALWDWGPHDISMAIDLLGNLPEEVSGNGLSSLRPNTTFYDMCNLKLKFPGDIYVFINIGWLSPIKKRSMTIVGEKSTIVFDDTIEKKVTLISNSNADKKISYPLFSEESPLTVEISSFVNRIKNKEKHDGSSLKMGLDVVRVLEACEKSMKQDGKTIKINES